MEKNATFWNKAAARYSKSPVKDMEAYAYTLERTKEYLNTDMAGYEFGCGTGSTAIELAPHLGHLTATDFSTNMIEIAQEKARTAEIETLDFRVETLVDIANVHPRYDVVMGFNILHLFHDIEHNLAIAHGLLNSGGLLITKTPCLKGSLILALLRPILTLGRWIGKIPYVDFLTTTELEKMVIDQGFEIIETGDYPKSPPSHFIVARKP
ncbi:hypothetical protein GCM10007939_05980 [Amylibacter marinus]|uniref:Methyltransferase type 12 domain-containing protein n=1 Tax=Amylibacter marinus TaxID=1475483 RepID=A0ABQ5VSP6_9RHOB|nr:class I SAM-dependent methyltransferase [Amylibacter marinus]GLQ34315.1 hypothetical protein GCM10007939_05980 [Amylibacter marinus]